MVVVLSPPCDLSYYSLYSLLKGSTISQLTFDMYYLATKNARSRYAVHAIYLRRASRFDTTKTLSIGPTWDFVPSHAHDLSRATLNLG